MDNDPITTTPKSSQKSLVGAREKNSKLNKTEGNIFQTKEITEMINELNEYEDHLNKWEEEINNKESYILKLERKYIEYCTCVCGPDSPELSVAPVHEETDKGNIQQNVEANKTKEDIIQKRKELEEELNGAREDLLKFEKCFTSMKEQYSELVQLNEKAKELLKMAE